MGQNKKIGLDELKKFGIYSLDDVKIDRLTKPQVNANQGQDGQQGQAGQSDRPSSGSVSSQDIDQDNPGGDNISIRGIILRLINQNDEVIIRKVGESIDPELADEPNLEVIKKRIFEFLNSSNQPVSPSPPTSPSSSASSGPDSNANSATSSSSPSQDIATEELFPSIKTSGVILKKTDLIELSEVEVEGKKHRKVILEGNVEIEYQNGNIIADIITINLETREIFGEGNVKVTVGENVIEGDSAAFKLREEKGYINNAYGLQEGNYFRVNTFRVNSTKHFTLENGWVTFSRNDDPFYHVYFDEVEIYGDEKNIFINPVVSVHNHGFLWIPIFNRYPLTSSLDVSFGVTRREGFYLLTKRDFILPFFEKINVAFNIYEKLGYYLNIVNQNRIVNSTYKLDFTGVYYSDNNVTKDGNVLTYSYNTSPYLNGSSSFRYKVAYDHTFDLLRTKENVSSTLKLSLYNTSDPLLTDNFRKNLDLDHLEIERILRRHDRDEDIYRLPNNPSDNDFYKISQTLTAPGTSLAVNLNWLYGTYDEQNQLENLSSFEERYIKYLRSVTLPSINFKHSGVVDPNDDEGDFHLNIGYGLGLSYSQVSTFKDGKAVGSGTGTDTLVEPYALLKEANSFKVNANLNRGISIDKDKNSIFDLNQDWFYWDITPSFSADYSRNWDGVNFTSENNIDSDKAILKLNYGVGSSIDILGSQSAFTSFKVNNNWSLGDEETTINLPTVDSEGNTQRKIKKISSSYSLSTPFSFPSTRLKGVWAKSDTWLSMLPTFDYNFAYNQNKRTRDEKSFSEPLSLEIIDRRDFTTSFSGGHNGYGFLYVPYLNYRLSSKLNFKYDLLPILDSEGEVVADNYFTDERFWDEDRIQYFNGDSSWNFNLNINPVKNTLNNSLSYEFFDTNERRVKTELIKYGLSYNFSFSPSEKNNMLDLESLSFGYSFNYFFRERDYLSDSMSFNFRLSLRIINLFNLNFSFNTSNPDSHLYFPDKAEFYNQQPVNFFEDIVNSLGFNGLRSQREALFKLRNITFELVHDIDDWQARFSYSIIPRNFVEQSFRGFYYDNILSFDINLKPENDPRGPKAGQVDPFFNDIERNFSPYAPPS